MALRLLSHFRGMLLCNDVSIYIQLVTANRFISRYCIGDWHFGVEVVRRNGMQNMLPEWKHFCAARDL